MKKVKLPCTELACVDRGAGMPVLLVHGFPLDHTMWNPQIEALAEQWRVIAPDLRGFGQSSLGSVEPERGMTMEQYAEDLAKLLDALAVEKPIVLVGFSMGGYIAWQFMRKYAHRVRALVVCDSKAVPDTEEARAGRLKMAENVGEWGAARVAEMMGPRLLAARTLETRPEVAAAVRQVIERTSVAAIAAAQRGMASRPDVTSLFPTIQVPTLVMVGAEDAISPPDEMRLIADVVPGAQFVKIAAAGHMTTLENPLAVNEALLRFLEGMSR